MAQRNAGLGVANGALLVLGDALLHPTIVVALFVSLISNSYLLVGLVPAVAIGVALLPQIASPASARGQARWLVHSVWASIVRAAAIGALGAFAFARSDRPASLVVPFLVTYTIFSLAGGFATIPIVDILARSVSGNRLGLVFGQRNLWGGVLGLLAGIAIARILERNEGFPANFALIFFLAFVALSLAAYAAAMMQVPRGGKLARPRFADHVRDSPHLLSNEYFRRFLSFRAFLSVAAIADPFYIVYAHRQLDMPVPMIGLYLAALTVARFASNLVWGPVANRWGNRLVLQASALLRMLIPLLALALPPLLRWSVVADLGGSSERALPYAFGLLFVVYGVAVSGQALANMTYLLDIAPEDERPAYTRVVNSVLAVVACAPILGAVLLDRFGFQFLFLVAFLIGFAAVLSSGALHEPRVLGATPLLSRYRLLARSRRIRG